MSRLFVVATPIGNLQDITLRALEVLRTVPQIAAEDTRHTARLLRHYNIATPLVSFHEHNRRRQLPHLLNVLGQGDLALVSDAGTPAISDPGADLVRAAASAGHEVVPLPGPSALAAILSVAGFDLGPVHFLGFLPRRRGPRQRLLQQYVARPGMVVFYESPHRLRAALEDIAAVAGDHQLVLGRELTKLHEEVLRGTAAELASHFASREPRGEFVGVVQGSPGTQGHTDPPSDPIAPEDEAGVMERFEALVHETGDRRQALRQLAVETGWPRRDLYRLVHRD